MPRITLCAIEPRIVYGLYSPFSQGIRQIRASIEADPRLSDWEVRFVETTDTDVEQWAETLVAERADVIGFSCYVWSFAVFVAVAERVRRMQPNVRLIFGGPAARTVMFRQSAFAGRERVLDAMVAGEGEWAIVALLLQKSWDLQTLAAIPNVHVPTLNGWKGGLPEPIDRPMDALPSAILAGLCDSNRTSTMERFRGCPMSCAFCQWGDNTTPHRVFGEARIHAELSYLKARNVRAFQLVDAGLNLNKRAFQNFARVEAELGFFKEAKLYACIYPSIVTDEHLEFLAKCKDPVLDVGVQSFNPAALDAMDRPFRPDRFEAVMRDLMRVSSPEIDIIFGLPGDNPRSFKDGVLRLLQIGCRVRAFQCLVLPDALMSRAKPEHLLTWDPETLLVTSAAGWTPRDLAETRAWLDAMMVTTPGETSNDTWTFKPVGPGGRMSSHQLRPMRVADANLQAQLKPFVAAHSGGAWEVWESGFTEAGMRVNLRTRFANFHVDLILAERVKQFYRVLEGVAVSYRTQDGTPLQPEDVRTLDRLLPDIVRVISPVLRRNPVADTAALEEAVPHVKVLPTREGLTSAWQKHGVLVLEKVVPEAVCEQITGVLNRFINDAAERERTQPWPDGFAARLKASANSVVPFWDPTVPAERPPVDKLMRLGHQLHQIPEIAALYRRPEILGTLSVTLKTPLLVNAVLIDKVPGGSVQFGIHQDSWYLFSEPESLVSMQIALDATEEDNGCLHLLPTDPATEVVTMRAILTDDGWQEGPEVHKPPLESTAPAMPLSRGSVLLYTGRTWHASYPNKSNRHRRVLVAQFIDASSTWAKDNWLPEPDGGFPEWK